MLVADQAETSAGGVVTPAVRESLIALAAKYPEKIFLADSRRRIHLFRNLMVKPNHSEAEAACKELFGSVDFKRLRETLASKGAFCDAWPQGRAGLEEGKETWSKPRPVEKPVDICGAGDSFAAGTALTMAVTHDPVEAASFGNIVASITVMKKGTGTASPQKSWPPWPRTSPNFSPGRGPSAICERQFGALSVGHFAPHFQLFYGLL